MTKTIESNQNIQNLKIIDNIYVCVCDYINSNVKTSKKPKNIYN